MTKVKPGEIAAVITGNAIAFTGLFVVVHNVVHRETDQWWDGRFVAGLIVGGILLAYYKRVGQALRAVKDFIPIAMKKGGE